jgi:predicted amidohydrolase YtcJ
MRVLLPVTAGVRRSLQAQPADLVLRNGKIVTMNAAPTAQAIAVRAGKITALGADSASRWIGP